MDYQEIKQKAAKWLQEIKDRYNYKEIEPCDFFLPDLTVLDLIMIADDVEMLSEMLIVHGADSISPCLCEALTYIPELEKNECYKTLRVAEAIDIQKCIEMRREMMSGMMAPLMDKLKNKNEEENENGSETE